MIQITAVGDIMLGRDLYCLSSEQIINLLDRDVLNLLNGHIVTGNLECLLTNSNEKHPFSHFHLKAKPEIASPLIRKFHVVNCANNHFYDYLDSGIDETLNTLREINVKWVGVGTSWEEANKPAIFQVRNEKIAVFGITTVSNIPPRRSKYILSTPDNRTLKHIENVANKYNNVIVHLHSGGGDFSYPSPTVRKLHKKIIDHGAKIILGHHPHVIQGWKIEKKCANFYSLGDFIFDRVDNCRNKALIVRINISSSDLSCEVIPVIRRPDFRIDLPNQTTLRQINKKLEYYCHVLKNKETDSLYSKQFSSNSWSLLISEMKKEWYSGGIEGIYRRLLRISPRKLLLWIKALAHKLLIK